MSFLNLSVPLSFHKLFTKKIIFFATAVQLSLGWEVPPHAHKTVSHSAKTKQCALGLYSAGATDLCREEKYDFSLSCLPVHWDRHFSSSEKHHWSFKS